MAAEGIFGMPWWLILAIAVVVVLSALLPAIVTASRADRARRKDAEDAKKEDGDADDGVRLEDEPWCPRLEVKDWQAASQLPGCPWNFDDCASVAEALDRIWRKPLCKDLQGGFDALKPRIKALQIARVALKRPNTEHFAAIYTLSTGAELFGGAPAEHAVGLDLSFGGADGDGDDDEDEGSGLLSGGLRRRAGAGAAPGAAAALSSPQRRPSADSEAFESPLPCLLPFYRIHDGFGVLLSAKHLPLLLASPGDTVGGSCFYVYPSRGLEEHGRKHLFKFARVDKNCVACADARAPEPNVIYVEKHGEQIEDDEHPLSFISDTVCNVAGQRVVPPSYMGGPSAFSTD